MLSLCFIEFSVSVKAFVIGLSQISSFFSCLHVRPNYRFVLFRLKFVDYLKSIFNCENLIKLNDIYMQVHLPIICALVSLNVIVKHLYVSRTSSQWLSTK